MSHSELVRELRGVRRTDGGFAPAAGADSELEPTALAALALGGDAPARRWLERRQRPDGGFQERDGRIAGPTSAALAALALEGARAGQALEFAVSHRGLALPDARNPELRGWGWTSDTRSFVEPTSRVLLATKCLAPSDRGTRETALRLLAEWQCFDGGWNHGVAHVLDAKLPGYAQTTAIALIALQRETGSFVDDGLEFLRTQWRREPGGLTTAQALVAFRFHGMSDEVDSARVTLGRMALDPTFRQRAGVLAWTVLATGPDELLDRLRARP